MVFTIDFICFQMNENTFEAFGWCLVSILTFSVELKHFWSLWMMFAIDFKYFWVEGNTFEALQAWLASILGIFEWEKTLLKLSHGVSYPFCAFQIEWKHFWSFRMMFAIDLKHFRMEGNLFEAFGWYLLSILSIFRLKETLLKLSDDVCYRS